MVTASDDGALARVRALHYPCSLTHNAPEKRYCHECTWGRGKTFTYVLLTDCPYLALADDYERLQAKYLHEAKELATERLLLIDTIGERDSLRADLARATQERDSYCRVWGEVQDYASGLEADLARARERIEALTKPCPACGGQGVSSDG